MKILVIGSGLSSYGACLSFINQKIYDVEVLDVGITKQYINQPNKPIPNGKDINGSFFPYGLNDDRWPIKIESKRICSSHAFGGFSKVYSGSILRAKNKDLLNWPRQSIPSDDDYQEILNSLNISQSFDDLNNSFPIDPYSKADKIKKWIFLGKSRIAFSKNEKTKQFVPFDCSLEFEKWSEKGLIKYSSNQYVFKINRKEKDLEVIIIDDGKYVVKNYDAIYIGAGCINTTALVDRSLFNNGVRKYKLLSAPLFLNLYLNLNNFIFNKKKKENNLHIENCCRYFLEFKSIFTSNNWTHVQIGDLNQNIKYKIEKFLKFPFKMVFIKVINIFQFSTTSFHSSLGPQVNITSRVDSKADIKQKIFIDEPNYKVNIFLSLITKIAVLSKFKEIKLIPIPFSSYAGNILRKNSLGGWHYGGTMPMKTIPVKDVECFSNGEIKGLKNVFIIDSSNFPSIPGSTVALLTMANAYRIVRLSIEKIKNSYGNTQRFDKS